MRTGHFSSNYSLTFFSLVFFSGGILYYCHVKRNTIELQYPDAIVGKKVEER